MNTITILSRNQQAMDLGFYTGETYLIENAEYSPIIRNESLQAIQLVNLIKTGVKFSAHFNFEVE